MTTYKTDATFIVQAIAAKLDDELKASIEKQLNLRVAPLIREAAEKMLANLKRSVISYERQLDGRLVIEVRIDGVKDLPGPVVDAQ